MKLLIIAIASLALVSGAERRAPVAAQKESPDADRRAPLPGEKEEGPGKDFAGQEEYIPPAPVEKKITDPTVDRGAKPAPGELPDEFPKLPEMDEEEMKKLPYSPIWFPYYIKPIVGAINNLAQTMRETSCCKRPRNCQELLKQGFTQSGVYTVYAGHDASQEVKVYCDMETDGGGWIVFQRRNDGSQNFKLYWNHYKNGFGDLNNEFWLGNEYLNLFTSATPNEMRVDIRDLGGSSKYARYASFHVESSLDKYRLSVSGYTWGSTAGDSLSYHNGMQFTTIDQDNDLYGPWSSSSSYNCAVRFEGAWWYRHCHQSNLNGRYLNGYHASYANGVNWYHYFGATLGYHYSFPWTEMKIRPL